MSNGSLAAPKWISAAIGVVLFLASIVGWGMNYQQHLSRLETSLAAKADGTEVQRLDIQLHVLEAHLGNISEDIQEIKLLLSKQ